MTPTPNPTAEQIVSEALGTYGLIGRARDLAARNAVEQLRTHGLLSEGAPSEEQIERAAQAAFNRPGAYRGCIWAPGHLDSTTEATRQEFRDNARAALTAAGVASQEVIDDAADEQDDLRLHMLAPQEPSRLPDFFAPKPMPNAPVLPSSGVDVDALAEVLCRVMDGETYEGEPCSACRQQARAVAEWLKGQGRGSEM